MPRRWSIDGGSPLCYSPTPAGRGPQPARRYAGRAQTCLPLSAGAGRSEQPAGPDGRLLPDRWLGGGAGRRERGGTVVTITSSGIKVYDDWRDNIVVDPDAPPLVWKAGRGVFGTYTSVPGRPYLASENSEDALSWNLFRTLERTGHLDVVASALDLEEEDEFQVLYWYRPWDSAEPLPEIKAALDRVEPWGRIGGHYQTETDVVLKGQRYLVMVECKLGKPGTHVRAWERGSRSRIPPAYEEPLCALVVDMQDWEATMRRFYQLLRHLVLAGELCRPDGWPLEPHLLAIVNDLNLNRNGVPHAAEFEHFRRALRLAPEQTHLLTGCGISNRRGEGSRWPEVQFADFAGRVREALLVWEDCLGHPHSPVTS